MQFKPINSDLLGNYKIHIKLIEIIEILMQIFIGRWSRETEKLPLNRGKKIHISQKHTLKCIPKHNLQVRGFSIKAATKNQTSTTVITFKA